jgi:hypothetical protein
VERIGRILIQSPGAPCNDDEYENDSDLWKIEHRIFRDGDHRSIFSEGVSAPHAICLAALRAVE